MKTVELSSSRLSELIERFSRARIGVLGDFFLDKYLDVDPALAEPSVETGKVAHQVVGVRCSPGAAGTVVCNLAALGAGQLHAIGFSGDDGEGFELRNELTQLGCSTEHLHISSQRHTPTYLKPRDASVASLEAEHSRYDTKNRSPTPADVERLMEASLEELLPDLDAVVVLDQVDVANSGVATDAITSVVSEKARQSPDTVFWADSRRRIREFRNLIIKPNQFEVMGIDNPLPGDEVAFEELIEAAQRLRDANQSAVVLTRGIHGMVVSDPEWTLVPGVRVEGPIDPTGAGDSATAGTVLGLCADATLPEAALIGNLVASITIQQINTTGTASPGQLADQLRVWSQRG